MWNKGQFPSDIHNPWQYSSNNAAPFDQEFYLVLNVAVGGVGGYWPDGVGNKPWSNNSPNSVNQFYDAKGQWYSTWSEKSAMVVDSVKIWSIDSDASKKMKRSLI